MNSEHMWYYYANCGRNHFIRKDVERRYIEKEVLVVKRKCIIEDVDPGDPFVFISPDKFSYVTHNCHKVRVRDKSCPVPGGCCHQQSTDLVHRPRYEKRPALPTDDFSVKLHVGDEERVVPSSVRTFRGADGELYFQSGVTSNRNCFENFNMDSALQPRSVAREEKYMDAIRKLKTAGDECEQILQRRPCVRIRPEGCRDNVGYETGSPRRVDTNPVWQVQDWTRQFVESRAGEALHKALKHIENLTETVEKLSLVTDDLALTQVQQTPHLPIKLNALCEEVTSAHRGYASKPTNLFGRVSKPLTARFISNPHEVSSSSGSRWIAERALPMFTLRAAGREGVEVSFVIDHACVRSVTSSEVCRMLYNDGASIGPPKLSRLSHRSPAGENGNVPHTQIFWQEHRKHEFRQIHYFNFEFVGLNNDRLSQTISVNECERFDLNIIVLGLDFLRHRPCVYLLEPYFEIRFPSPSDRREVRVPTPCSWVRVVDQYMYDRKNGRVLMGEEARRVLFFEPYEDDAVSFGDLDRSDYDKMQHLVAIAPRSTDVLPQSLYLRRRNEDRARCRRLAEAEEARSHR